MKEHTEEWWRKFVTMEMFASVLVGAFIAGGVWMSLNSSVALAQTTAELNKKELISLNSTVANIRTDVAVIKANQLRDTQLAEKAAREREESRKDIKEILRRLSP